MVIYMANTSIVHSRIDTNLKENAESIMQIPAIKPLALESMTATDLDGELNKGIASLANGKDISADDFDSMLNKEFGIFLASLKKCMNHILISESVKRHRRCLFYFFFKSKNYMTISDQLIC